MEEEEPLEKEEVGKVTHYFTNIGVGVIELSDEIKIGDKISIEGATTNFQQEVESMQIEHEDVEKAEAGDSIGLKVKDRIRENDVVYRLKSPSS